MFKTVLTGQIYYSLIIQSSVLNFTSACQQVNSYEHDKDEIDIDINVLTCCINDPIIDHFKKNILYSICEFVVRKIQQSLSCAHCW